MTTESPSVSAPEARGSARTRTVTWNDPAASTAVGMSMPGLDYLRAIIAGTAAPPPIAALMGGDLVSAEHGHVVFTCRPDESTYNTIGSVHGGLLCTLLDSALGCALHSTLPQGKGYTSVEIKVNYLKAVRLTSGMLTATGRVVRSGSRVGFTEGTVTDADGAVVATASSTLLIFDL